MGYDKTIRKLQQEAYWVYMSRDVEQYCRQCTKCNASKPPAPQHAPMTSVPIGKPWQMMAADILEVPVSSNNNRYLLVIQEYFTKWVEVASAYARPNCHMYCFSYYKNILLLGNS